MTARRVAVLSDVHGNAVALAAVLEELEADPPDLVVFGGDLTWGPLPEQTLELIEPWRPRAIFVRGNADRAVVEAAAGDGELTERERWMVRHHTGEQLAFLESFVQHAVVDVDGIGPVRFCHGSPRSDEECVTPETPEARIRQLSDGVAERVIVSAHTHVRFDRLAAGVRSVNPGSVGMPYEPDRGAYWALLGPDVELRRTEYDVDEAVARYRETDDPVLEQIVEMLVAPPSRDEVIAHAERLVFSG